MPCAATFTGIKYPPPIGFILWENVVYMGFIVFIYHIIRIRVAMVRRSSVPMRHGHSPSLSPCDRDYRDMPYQIRPLGHIQYIPSHWLALPTIELPPPTFSKERNGRLCVYLFSFLTIFYIYYCHMLILRSTYSRRIFIPKTPAISMFFTPSTTTVKGVLIRAYDIFIHILL